MKKLELKHIAPYLVHGVKCFCTEFNNGEILTLESFYFSSSSKELKLIFKEKNGGSSSTSCKPILRPLSQLTQDKKTCAEINLLLEPNGLTISNFLLLTNSGVAVCISWQEMQEVLNILYREHYDVFGLIEQKLAIEKS